MANTKISVFPTVKNNDVPLITAFAAVGTDANNNIGVNVKISGDSLITSLEQQLDLSNFLNGTLAVNRGGTGQTSYTDGQLLIGNSTGNTLSKATLTQGTDLSITNGNGSITIDHGSVANTPATNSTTLSAGGNFTAINSVTVSNQGHLIAQNTETYTLPSDSDTTYGISASDGDNTDEEKIVLTAGGSGSGTSTVVLEAGTGLTIARLSNKITFTNNNPTAASAADPSATISGAAVNGSATTFMRSDAAPALGNTITIGSAGTARGLVDVQGGSSSDAQLRLNCSAGTHAVVIEGPQHSGGNNYIIKLPHGAPALNKILKVGTYTANAGTYADPSLATMVWGDASITQSLIIAASDETTALSTGTGKATFRMPYAFTLTDVRASVGTAPAGSAITVDINEGGSSILSTKITIDAGEKTSTTAATAPVISDSALADDAEITIDIDTVGSSTAGAGLKVTLIGNQ